MALLRYRPRVKRHCRGWLGGLGSHAGDEDRVCPPGARLAGALKVDSGNGCYRLYRIDLPNDEPSLELIKNCYAGLNELLGGYDPSKPHATLDTTVYNAARIARVGGTWNRKGDPTSDRPHRICVYHEPEPDHPIEIVA